MKKEIAVRWAALVPLALIAIAIAMFWAWN
ncbi:hypothetical protein M2317_003250 [Microbacterium sp. ZKA21]